MNKTILIGLDGATFTILDPLFEKGALPNLKALVTSGVRCELLSTPHPLTPPSWTTLQTGMNPGVHGIFDFLRAERRKGGAFFTLNNFHDIQSETIWSMVDREGGSSISLNFPCMAPPPKINATIVPGLLSARHLKMNVHPPEVYEEMKALPDYRPEEFSWDFEQERKATIAIPEEELEQWVEFHIKRETHWFNLLRSVMKSRPADLTAIMFDGPDKLQHAVYRYLDPNHFHENPTEIQKRIQSRAEDYFKMVDGFIGELVETAEPETRVFFASDHGFGASFYTFRVNAWLEQMGYLVWPADDEGDGSSAGQRMRTGHHVAIDMEKTRVYAESAATNGVQIRVEETPGDGGVPKDEYPAFREKLIRELLDAKDPHTGKPIVQKVLKREDVFPGPFCERAPNLTLVMCDYGFVSVLKSDEIVTPRDEPYGTHYPEGVFIAHGAGIREGEQLPQANMLQMCATLLYSLGIAIPEDMEGAPILGAFTEQHVAAHPLATGAHTVFESVSDQAKADSAVDEEEEEKIIERLRALGYVE